MRALHLFPTFAPDSPDGSDYCQRMLTRALTGLGVEVEVLTTCSAKALPRSAFGRTWPADYAPGATSVDGVAVRRFPVRLAPPLVAAHLLSRPILSRWRREEAEHGVFTRGSAEAVESYRERAMSRPAVYDYLALAARGPHSPSLVRAAHEAARRSDVVLAGFAPFATLFYAARVAERAGKPLVVLPLFHP